MVKIPPSGNQKKKKRKEKVAETNSAEKARKSRQAATERLSGDRKEAIIRSSSYKVTLKQTVSSINSSVGQIRLEEKMN